MKKNILTIFAILVTLGLIFFLIGTFGKNVLSDLMGTTQKSQENTVPVKNEKLLDKKVPFFDLQGLDDSRVKLSSFVDKPFVIVFWASHNTESSNQLKIIDEYNASLKKEDRLVPVVFIDSQEDTSSVKSFIKRGGYDVLVALDSKGGTTESFNIKSLPTIFFVDRDGIIREIYSGVVSKTMFVDKIEQLLK